MFCIFCGKELYEGSIYCGYCGKNVSEAMDFIEKDNVLKIQVNGNVNVNDKIITSANKDENDIQIYKRLVKKGDFARAESMKDELLLNHKNDVNLMYYFLLAENMCKDDAELKKCNCLLEDSYYYTRIMELGNNQLKKKLITINAEIRRHLDAEKRREQEIIDKKNKKRNEEIEARRQQQLLDLQAEISENINRLKECEVQDIITFGRKGLNPIEWVVAEKKEDRIMVFSKECLNPEYSWGGYEKIPFNKTRKDSEWVNSSIRQWLNEDFYNTCFEPLEREKILEVKHPIDKTIVYPIEILFNLFKKQPDFEPGEDKIFLVSNREWISIGVYSGILDYIPEMTKFILRDSEDWDDFSLVSCVQVTGGTDEYRFTTERVSEPSLIYAAMWLSLV